MSTDDRLQVHIANWMRQLSLPAVIELRFRDETIDNIHIDKDSDFDMYAADLLDSATTDAHEEGKKRDYRLVAIVDANQFRYECPIRIKRRVDRSTADYIAALIKQNTELHQLLTKERKTNQEMLLKYAQELSEENSRHRQRSTEVIDKLEGLRSKQLERDLALEKHKADIEVKERITEVVVPLLMAIGHKFTNGKFLPAPDMNQVTLHEVAKSLSEQQLETIQSILGSDFEDFAVMLDSAFAKADSMPKFRAFTNKLPNDKLMAIIQVLNVGQQAALKELLSYGNGQSH